MKIYQTIEVLNRFIGLELLFTTENLWYYGKKPWYYTENYGTIPKSMEL